MEIRNKKWPEDELFAMRKEVLAQWPTGSEVNLEEAIEYHKQIPLHKKATELTRRGREGKLFVSKMFGHPLLDDQIEHVGLLEAAGVDSIHHFLDTYTRKGQFEKAQEGLEHSRKHDTSILNGYPVVNQGVYNTRKLIEGVNIPMWENSGSDEDPRLSQEIALAGGFTGTEFHHLQDLIQHSKDYPLDKRIINDQYGTRLAAYYAEHGAPNDLFTPAPLGGLEPPEMRIVVLITQSLLAAEQGVKDITMVLVSTAHLVQMAAALRALRKLAREYLDSFGYTDTNLNFMTATWQGSWPPDLNEAAAFLAWNVAIGVLGGVDGIVFKAINEAQGLCTREADVASAKIAKKVIDTIGTLRLPDSEELKLEETMISRAVRAIVNRVLELGDGDAAIGEMKAVEQGVIDVAFSPWQYLARKVMPIRDASGAIRYLQYGNLPLPGEVIDYHKQKVAERRLAEGTKEDIEMVIRDTTRFSRPLFKGI
ncbi:methylaspartate mutase subunit E [Chloroflexota bacterium]